MTPYSFEIVFPCASTYLDYFGVLKALVGCCMTNFGALYEHIIDDHFIFAMSILTPLS